MIQMGKLRLRKGRDWPKARQPFPSGGSLPAPTLSKFSQGLLAALMVQESNRRQFSESQGFRVKYLKMLNLAAKVNVWKSCYLQ